jgi:hypothetical protein
MPLPATTGRMVRRLPLAVTFLAIVIVAGPAAQQSSAQSSPVSIPAWVPIYPGARLTLPDRTGEVSSEPCGSKS